MNAVRTLSQNSFYRDLNPEFETRTIAESSPSVEASMAEVKAALRAAHSPAVVNFTGGTKLMSIGAWRAAGEAGTPTLYCDTQCSRFELERWPAGFSIPPFEQVVAGLDVPVALAAHGLKADRLKSEHPDGAMIALSHELQRAWVEHEEETNEYFTLLRQQVHPNGRDLRKSDVERVLASGLPPAPPALSRVLELAQEAQLIEQVGELWRFKVPARLNTDQKVRAVQDAHQMLEGGWFEIVVHERMKSCGRFLDVRMNVTSRDQHVSFGENDVVAVDLKRMALTFVSCKSTDVHIKPLEHVYSVRQRAVEFGGSHAGAVLCIRRCFDAQKRRTLKDACAAVRAEFIEGDKPFEPQP
jgi:hypothetical protein